MYINTNYNSLVSRGYLSSTNKDLTKTMERLSSGKRINGASDDAAGLAISTRMTAQIRGMDVATRNAQDGISMIQTAESAMGSVSDILQRMRELAVQADNGTYAASDVASMQGEFDALLSEIDHIAETTSFNGINLIASGGASVTLHISDKFDDTLTVDFAAMDTTTLSITGLALSGNAQTVIDTIDTALDTVSTERGNLGASINRLDFVVDNLVSAKNNTSASRSRIEDADMAAEMSELTKQQILQQSTMAMLSRANSQPQGVLSLLQG
jgi:flagellin